jgi:D-aminoacyl-tRNA deacylase
MIGDAGIVLLSESEILEVGDLEWTTYLAIRDLAEEIAPGSRVHVHNLSGGGTPVPVRLNPELIEETVKNNREGFLNLLEGLPVAHLSRGSMEVLPLVIGFEGATFRLVSDITTFCVKLLLICENTVIAGDHLILRKVRFDPAKARRHEVPKGPLFATLAGGRAIEIDGRRITPDMVQTTSVKRIHIPGLERYI